MLTRVLLDQQHKHPVSGKYPRIESADAWISEVGRQSTLLQSTLSLHASSTTRWIGPSQLIEKLGQREVGVDTPLMGDKQKGFQQGSSYAVFFSVQFPFGVTKGAAFPNKQMIKGNEREAYQQAFHIIGNAWERQGLRNHTTH
jgi:hypothetical protein